MFRLGFQRSSCFTCNVCHRQRANRHIFSPVPEPALSTRAASSTPQRTSRLPEQELGCSSIETLSRRQNVAASSSLRPAQSSTTSLLPQSKRRRLCSQHETLPGDSIWRRTGSISYFRTSPPRLQAKNNPKSQFTNKESKKETNLTAQTNQDAKISNANAHDTPSAKSSEVADGIATLLKEISSAKKAMKSEQHTVSAEQSVTKKQPSNDTGIGAPAVDGFLSAASALQTQASTSAAPDEIRTLLSDLNSAKPSQTSKRKRRALRKAQAEKEKQQPKAQDSKKPSAKPQSSAKPTQKGPKPTPRRKTATRSRHEVFQQAGPAIETVEAGELEVQELDLEQPPVPELQYGLNRVLFNPGVYQLQDMRTRVYNFDPYLEHIMPVEEFDFNSLKEYKTSSRDTMLSQLAKRYNRRYVGSTSSMTGTLAHFHYLLSNWRELNLSMLSRLFPETIATFTNLNKAPNAIFLRYRKDSGTYAIDVDKEHDTPNVLMMLGKSMELLLTKPREEFERHRKGVEKPITDAERSAPESYQYTVMGDFLMRSQLDAHDPRLPGTGMFDLKTRAVITVRMKAQEYEEMAGYEIQAMQGKFQSYERELYDMMRSTILKYSLQVRMGRMDGIFLAFHNVSRIFGFQYLPVHDMDKALHGQVDRCLGDHEFKLSLDLLNKIFDKATAKFPEQSLRMHFYTEKETETKASRMIICAEPMEDAEIEQIQSVSKAKVEEFERRIMDAGNESGNEDEPASDLTDNPASALDKPEVVEVDAEHDDGTTSASPSIETAKNEEVLTASADTEPLVEDSAPEEKKPIFVATLTIRNMIKTGPSAEWKYCKANRPRDLIPKHQWRVQYILKELEQSPKELHKIYRDVKGKRKKIFDKLTKTDEPGKDGKVKPEDYYIRLMREMAKRGRDFRRKLDAQDKGREKIVLDVKQSQITEKINSTEDYMEWMYKQG